MLKTPIFYLRRNNFDSNGNIKNEFLKNKILIVFIHAEFCIYCQNAKGDYQRAAIENNSDNIYFSAIQADGDIDGEKECDDILEKMVSDFRGFPDYAIFINGKPSLIQIPGRDYKTILQTLKQIEYDLNNK